MRRVLKLSDGRSYELPWKEPGDNIYCAHDGPDEVEIVSVAGHEFHISNTGAGGVHSGRNCYRVECMTCREVIHEGSTSATAQIRFHVDGVMG